MFGPREATGLRRWGWVLLLLMAVVRPALLHAQDSEPGEKVRFTAHAPYLPAATRVGYWPVVCIIENIDERAHTVELRCPGRYGVGTENWRVFRRVRVEPQSSVRIPLWLLVRVDQGLGVEVLVDGRPMSGGAGGWTVRASAGASSTTRAPLVLASRQAAMLVRGWEFGDRHRGYRFLEDPSSPSSLFFRSAILPPTVPRALGAPRVDPFRDPGGVDQQKPAPLVERKENSAWAIGGVPDLVSRLGIVDLTSLGMSVWEMPLSAWDGNWISYSAFHGLLLTPEDWEQATP